MRGRVLDVVRAPATVLSTVGGRVDPRAPETVQLAADLVATMRVSPGCVGLAAPQVGVGARVFAVGNDWDGAVARTPRTGQLIASSWLDPAGNTFWVQMMQAPEPRMGLVTVADTAPTNHQWNYAAVEIQPR